MKNIYCRLCRWPKAPGRTRCYLCEKKLSRCETLATTSGYEISMYTAYYLTKIGMHKL